MLTVAPAKAPYPRITFQRIADPGEHDLDGFRGRMGAAEVRDISFDGQTDTYEPPINASDVSVFRARQECIIWYVRDVPAHA